MKKLLALLLAVVMVMSLAACAGEKDPTKPTDPSVAPTDPPKQGDDPTEPAPTEPERGPIEDYTFGVDYTSEYDLFGDKITIDDVYEVDGLAYAEVDGVEYELGMDFLSMAMVYKADPTEKFPTSDDVYNEWWRYYMQRWNYLMAEVPLYSNLYYHIINAKIQNYEVGPFWGVANALPLASVDETKGSNSVIMGSSTELGGSFRYASFGKTNPSGSDNDIVTMTSGYDTVCQDVSGQFMWDNTVVTNHKETVNDDGSKTFEITIAEGLTFSDGSPVTAKNYIVKTLVFGTPVATEAAAGFDAKAGSSIVGYKDYHDATEPTPFSGIRLLSDYTFSVTIAPDYLPYYYDITYAAFTPEYLGLWLDEGCDIADDGNGAYITGGWYDKNGDSYVHAAHILAGSKDITTYPYSGPYVISEYDQPAKTVTLTLNPEYKGNHDGIKPSIETISYTYLVKETQSEKLKAGELDILPEITGGDATNAALKIVEDEPDRFTYTYYDRAGYGKLGFRADFGPVYFQEVRQAIAYCIDRNAFAQSFCKGYGTVVHAPYYMTFAAYKANEDKMVLDSYAVSEASAIAVLEEGGWVYNADGTEYTGTGVRYKKLPRSAQSEANLNYKSIDGAYKTEKVGDDYYMPLVINWFTTTPNEVSDLLKTAWAGSELTANVGMNVQYVEGDFNTLLAELYQDPGSGYVGPATYCAFNFATVFPSVMYDYSWNWRVDPDWVDNLAFYFTDSADYVWLK